MAFKEEGQVMEDIRWQNPHKRKSAQKDRGGGRRPQSSYADRFLDDRRHGGEEFERQPQKSSGYSDQYLGSAYPPGQGVGSHAQNIHYPYQQPQTPPAYPPPGEPGQVPPQVHYQWAVPPQAPGNEYYQPSGPEPQNNGAYSTQRWRFLDLKNKKNTGDLYKKILAYNKKGESNAFCFTSSTAGEGVTTVLANLVDYIRNQGTAKTVIVIDANLDAPGLNTVFGLPGNTYGLKQVLERRIDIQSALYPVWQNVSVLCSGSTDKYRQGSLEPDDILRVVNRCKQMADFLLIDCPPILSSSDAFSVAPAADFSFLIVQAVRVRRQVAERAISGLQKSECDLAGVIMNRVQQVIPSWVYRYI